MTKHLDIELLQFQRVLETQLGIITIIIIFLNILFLAKLSVIEVHVDEM